MHAWGCQCKECRDYRTEHYALDLIASPEPVKRKVWGKTLAGVLAVLLALTYFFNVTTDRTHNSWVSVIGGALLLLLVFVALPLWWYQHHRQKT